jgi:hypothetical protein
VNRVPALRTLNELMASAPIYRLRARALAAGFEVRFVQFVEDASTPGLPGHIVGRTDRAAKVITISTHRRTLRQIAAALLHECQHAEGKEHVKACPSQDVRCGGAE